MEPQDQDQLKETKTMLRSLLLSTKDGINARYLDKEYKEMVGDILPYKKLGHQTLEGFIKALPDVVQVTRNASGEVMLKAVADASTAHILKLVSKQRSKKKLKKPVRRPAAHVSFQPRRPPLFGGAPRNMQMRPARPGFNPQWRPYVAQPTFKPQRGMPRFPGPNDNMVIVAQNSNSRSVRFSQNRLLDQAVSQASGDRAAENSRFVSNIDVPPRFRRRPQGEGDVAARPYDYGRANTKVYFPKVEDGPEWMKALEKYCDVNNLLPLNFDTVQANNGGYASSVKLKGVAYGSQGVYETRKEAEEAVAMTAVTKIEATNDYLIDDWEEPWAVENSADQTPELHPDHVQRLKERVKKIVKDKPTGLFGTRLPHEYLEKYDDDPPPDLLLMVRSWTDIAIVERNPTTHLEIIYPVLEDINKNKDLVIPRIQLLSDAGLPGVTVYVTFIYNPSFFYVQLEDSSIDNISETLAELCKDGKVPDVSLLTKGRFCAGIYSGDGNWSRAEIRELKNDTGVELLFVDFGNVETVNLKSVHWLSEDTVQDHAQAANCCLYGIQPLEGEAEWSKSASKVFAAEIQDKALIAVTQVQYEDFFEVELFLKSDTSISINQKLITMGVVRSTLPEETEEEAEQEEEEVVDDLEPESLSLPEDKEWDVHITFIDDSTNAVILRLVGEEYSDRLDQFESKLMEAFRSSHSDAPIKVGSVYVAYDDSLYHRVVVQETLEKKVRCYFLDHGDTDNLKTDHLQPLDPAVNRQLSYQAIQVSLYGLEEVASNVTTLEKICDLALGKTCVAEVIDRENGISVVLYDTSHEVDLNINEAILKAILSDGGGIDSPHGSTPDVRISPKHSPYTSEQKLSPLADQGSSSQPTLGSEAMTGSDVTMFSGNRLGQGSASVKDNSVCVNKPQGGQKADLSLTGIETTVTSSVDGNLLCVRGDNSSIIPDRSSEVTENPSFQYSTSWQPGNDQQNIGTNMSQTNSHVKSNQYHSALANQSSANVQSSSTPSSLASTNQEQDLARVSEALFSMSMGESGVEQSKPTDTSADDDWSTVWNPTEYLKRQIPPIFSVPAVDEFLDVHVIMIHDPSSFVCIPYEQMAMLDRMLLDMRDFFSSTTSVVLKPEEVQINHLYAGKNDGIWCRVKVSHFHSEDLISVHLVDLGYYARVTIKELQPLPWRFWKLPLQAFHAKLGSVKPVQTFWSEAAKFKFTELASDRDLVSLIQSNDPQTGVVSLRLIDTAGNSDICIDEVLVDRSYAQMAD